MSIATRIIDEIWQKRPDTIIELKKYVLNFLHNSGKSDLEALESLNNILKSVKRKLSEKIDNAIRKGIIPNFKFTTYSDDTIVGCYIFAKGRDLSKKLLFRETMYNTINSLDWDLFELLCKYVLDIYHFDRVNLGEKTKDGGLDFFGYYVPYSKGEYIGFLSQLNSRIFGQSKHYSSAIGEPICHEFHDLYLDFLSGQGRAYKYISLNQSWFLEVKGPIVPLFMTNNEFTSPAIEFAERKGILIREGVQIVEDIIRLSKAEPWFKEENGEIKYSDDEFIKFLKTYPTNFNDS